MPLCNNTTMTKNGIILSVGRLVERKGFQNVIYALAKIKSQVPYLRYIIAGSGEYEQELRKITNELHLEDTVIFKGRVSEQEKEQLLLNCDLMIMPSFAILEKNQVEGFGISLLEANAYGKFVISSNSGGIPEAVRDGETGFLVIENDINSIIEALQKYYNTSFTYNPLICIEWAQKRYIANIAHQYYMHISKEISRK